ncbi:hypothetical protein D7V86_00300 [bacterium D16-51]|nr:hypothetical protein D7V96_05065 [bacterium D16-59]RKI62683.1 hypothetical protein D7V86_00300 [bacterium D16-51]
MENVIESKKVDETFDFAFCEVTKKLVNLELHRVAEDDKITADKVVILKKGYREEIETHGHINSRIVCHFSDELFRYITDTMNNGITPSEEEIHLFLNEYINIACGHAISSLNNLTGRPSRLTIPRFYRNNDSLELTDPEEEGRYLVYRSATGMLHVFLFYSMQTDQEEGK